MMHKCYIYMIGQMHTPHPIRSVLYFVVVVVFVTDSFTLFRNQNCFRRKPTEQTLILPYLIFAHWQTQGESSLDQLLTILWIQSNPISEKNGLSLKVRLYLRCLRLFVPCKGHQTIRAITSVTQVLNTGLQGGYLNQVAIRFNSLLAIGCGNIAYSLVSCGSHHVS